MTRVCACPRREPMDGMPASVIYRHGTRCKQAAYRARLAAEAEAAGVFVAPSKAAIKAKVTGSPGSSNGDAEAPRKRRERKREQVRVGYRKAEAELAAALPPREASIAVAALRCALSPKQLEHLESEAA